MKPKFRDCLWRGNSDTLIENEPRVGERPVSCWSLTEWYEIALEDRGPVESSVIAVVPGNSASRFIKLCELPG